MTELVTPIAIKGTSMLCPVLLAIAVLIVLVVGGLLGFSFAGIVAGIALALR